MDTPEDSAADKNSPDKAEGEAKAVGGDAAGSDLPNVDSPRLAGAGDAEAEAVETAGGRPDAEVRNTLPALFRARVGDDAPEHEPASAAMAQPRSLRFALLAASLAAAAGIGALFGAFAASGFGHQQAALAAVPRSGDARDVVAALRAQLAEISALKASLDAAKTNAGAQFTKIGARLDSLERAQAEPSAKLTHIAEAIDRLGKQAAAAPDITGSIAASPAAAPAPAPAPALAANPPAPILHNWVVQDVRNGRAMVETAYGSFFLVGSGSILPGLGHVHDVKRQNGEWIVVTDKGLITQHP
jgi:hypothetical protein